METTNTKGKPSSRRKLPSSDTKSSSSGYSPEDHSYRRRKITSQDIADYFSNQAQKRGMKKLKSKDVDGCGSNLDKKEASRPQSSCGDRHQSQDSEYLYSSDDGSYRKGKKRSSLKRITEEDIAEYLNKKAQEKVMKAGKEVQSQFVSSNLIKINPLGKKVLSPAVPGYTIDINPLGDPNLNEKEQYHHPLGNRSSRRDVENSEGSDSGSNHVRKKKRITDYWSEKALKMVTKIVKEVQSQMVPSYFNEINPLGHCNLNEKERSCLRGHSNSRDDGKNCERTEKRITEEDIAEQAQEKVMKVVEEVQAQTVSGHSKDSNSLGGCNLNEQERSCGSSRLREDNDSSDDGSDREGDNKRSSLKMVTEETIAEKTQEKVMKEPEDVQCETISGDSNEYNPLGGSNVNEQQSNIMSSAADNSNLSSLHPVSPVSLSSQQAQKGKKKIIVLDDGSVVGDYSKAWNTRTGDFVRDHIPVSYSDWRQVPQSLKDRVWNSLMVEFELDVPPDVARPLLEKSWPQRFRTFKKALRSLLKSDDPLGAEPKGVNTDVWKKFVENESDPKKQQINAKNAENRQKLKYSHCLGRRTYAQKQYLMKKDQPEKLVGRVNNWLVAHKRSDGTVLASAKSLYDEIKAAQDRRKIANKTGKGCSNPFLDLENDELAEVFGKETRGRIRGMGSSIHKKQLIHIGVAKAKVEQIKKANEDAESMKNELISNITLQLDKFEDIMETVLSKLSNGTGSELGSDSVFHRSYPVHNLNNAFATMGASHPPHPKPPVILLDKFGKELAKGYVVTDNAAGECPIKEVGIGEKKVYAEEVFVPNARLYDPPQCGNTTMASYVAGGFLVWLDCWLKYI